MKKLLMVTLFISVIVTGYSQEYHHKKCYLGTAMPTMSNSLDGGMKFEGDIILSDTLITWEMSGTKSIIPVKLIMSNETSKQWKVSSNDIDIRFTFNKLFTKTYNCDYMIMQETKDNFSGNRSTLICYLTQK